MASIPANVVGLAGNYEQWIACNRKRAFATRKIAKDAAARIRGRGGPKLTPYKCPHCGSHHLASEQTNRSGKT